MTWQIITAANIVIAGAYFSISYIIASGLITTGQVSTNKLGLATALIFFTCGVHHGSHAVHMLLPSFGIDDQAAYALRDSWHWQSAVWDIATAMVGVYYLSLRGSYSSVLRGAQMFEDLKVRERQALEINDSIVQGLTVAKYQLDRGADGKSRDAIEDTLRRARGLISELLDEPGGGVKEPQPGDLRRASAATLSGDR